MKCTFFFSEYFKNREDNENTVSSILKGGSGDAGAPPEFLESEEKTDRETDNISNYTTSSGKVLNVNLKVDKGISNSLC